MKTIVKIRRWTIVLILILHMAPSLAQTLELVTQIGHQATITSIAMSDDGKYLASADKDGIVKIWDMATAQNRYTLSGYGPLFFFLNDQYLVANAHPEKKKSRKDFRYFRVPDFTPQKKIRREDLKNQEAIEHYSIVRRRRKIKLKPKISGLKKIVFKESGGRVMNIAVSQDGRYIAGGIRNGDLIVYDRVTKSRLKRIKPKAMYARNFSFRCPIQKTEFKFMQFSEKGDYLFFGGPKRIYIAEIEQGVVTQVVNLQPHWSEQLGAVANPADRQQSRMTIRHSQNYSPITSQSPIELAKMGKLPFAVYSEVPGILGLGRYASKKEITASLKTQQPYWGAERYDPNDFRYGTTIATEFFNEKCSCEFYTPANTINVQEDAFSKWDSDSDSLKGANGDDRAQLALTALHTAPSPQKQAAMNYSSTLLLTLNPAQMGNGEEKPFLIFKNPASNILPYFYYYNATDKNGNILPDTLVDIAYSRGDSTLINFFEQQTNVGWQLDRLRKQIELLESTLSFQDQSDTLQFTALQTTTQAEFAKLEKLQKRKIGDRIGPRKKQVLDFKLSKDDRYLILTEDRQRLSIFDLASGKLIRQHSFEEKLITDAIVSPDNRFLILADDAGTITRYTLPKMKAVQVFGPSTLPVNRIMINKGGTGMMTGEFSRSQGGGNFWDLKTGEKIGYVGANEYQKCWAGFDTTGNFLLIEGYLKHHERQMTLVTDLRNRWKVEIPIHQGLHRHTLTMEDGSSFLAVGGSHDMGLIERYSVSEGKLLDQDLSSVPKLITCLSPSASPNHVLLAGNSGILYNYDVLYMQIRDSIKLSEDWILTLALESSRNSLVTGGLDRVLRRVNQHTFKVSLASDSFPSPIKLVVPSPNGERLAVVDVSENVFIVNADNFEKQAVLPWRDESIRQVDWSEDGQYLLTHRTSKGLNHKGTGLNATRLWNLESLSEDSRFTARDDLKMPLLMAAHPNLPRILVGGNGRKLTCFDLNTGDSLFQATYLSALTGALCFDPAGNSFYTASHEVQAHWSGFGSKITNQTSRIISWDAHSGKVTGIANSETVMPNVTAKRKLSLFPKRAWAPKRIQTPLTALSWGKAIKDFADQTPKAKTYRTVPLVASLEVAQNGRQLNLRHWDNSFSVLDFATQETQTVKIPRDNYFHGFKVAGKRLYEFYSETYRVPKPANPSSLDSPGPRAQHSASDSLPAELRKRNHNPTSRFRLNKPSSDVRPSHLYGSGKSSVWGQLTAGNHAAKNQMKKKALKNGKIIAVRPLTSQSVTPPQRFRIEKLEKLLPYDKAFKLVKNSWGTPLRKFKPLFERQHHGTLNYSFGASDSLALTAGGDSQTIIWDTKKASPKLQIASTYNNAGHIMFDSLQNYLASRKAAALIGFAFGTKMYPFEVFDFYLNRPDRIIAQMPTIDSATVKLYESAHLRRRERLGVQAADNSPGFEVPTIEVNGPPSFTVSEADSIEVRIHAEDTTGTPLIRIEGWANDAPLFGLDGIDLSSRAQTAFDTVLSIPLSNGKNTIQFSTINQKLIQSWKETTCIEYIGPAHPSRLFVVSLGVSAYSKGLNSLSYPASDARHLAQYLQEWIPKKQFYQDVKTLVLTDKQVDAQSPQTISRFLAQAKADDRVLFYLSGHGFNSSLDHQYYFHTNSFKSDGTRNLFSFTQIDSLMAATPSRNKLLILNTCGSGDVDEQNNFRFGEDFLAMKELFLDLRRSSGTTVLAASSGYQYVKEFASLGTQTGPMVKFITQMLDGMQGEMKVEKFCKYIQYLFNERSSELKSRPEIRFANLRNNFRLF